MVFSKKFACGAKLVVFYSKFSPAAQNQWFFAKKFRLRRKISCFYSELLIFTIFTRKSKSTIFELPPCLALREQYCKVNRSLTANLFVKPIQFPNNFKICMTMQHRHSACLIFTYATFCVRATDVGHFFTSTKF